MSQRLVLFWCAVLGLVFTGSLFAQDNSAMWNQAKRMKFGLDKGLPSVQIQTQGDATLNTDSPPNTPDIQVFNPCLFWQSENSIGVNFSNPNHLMVSTNGRIPGSNPVVHQPWAFSTDNGVTWPSSLQSEDIPPGILDCFGDPVAFFDVSGRAYYCTLGSPGGIYFVSTTNFGATWSARSDGDPNHSTQDDKQHAAADYSGIYPNNIYTAWTDFNVSGSPVVFNRSTDQGTTWGTRQTLQVGSNRGQGVHIAIGPNGEVYVMWAHYTTGTAEVGIGMAKSTNGGASFSTPTVVYPLNGIRISNGGIPALNGARAASFPYFDVDRSNGSRRGWIYAVSPELDVPNTGQSDIFVHRSTDGGATWLAAVRVNGPDVQAGKWQFMPTIAVDPTTGNVTVGYYSMDSTGSNFMTNRYAAYSIDGGATWDNWVVSDVRALWAPQLTPNTNTTYNGDYYETAAMGGKAWLCWTDRRSGTTGASNKAYVERVIYSENFGWVKGTITNVSGGAPLQGVAVDFTGGILQQGGTSNVAGLYVAGAKVDTPGTTRNVTLHGAKFGFRDTLLNITITRNDTLTRNFAMTPLPGGTLVVRTVRRDSSNIRAAITVSQGGVTRASGFTDSLTGIFSAPLPIGAYDVLVDPASPYGNRRFTGVSITTGTVPLYVVVRVVVENSPAAMRDTLAIGGTHTKTMVLTNTTTDTVAFRLSDDNALARMKFSKPVVQPRAVPIIVPERPKGAPDTEHGDSPTGGGGPDAFGYRWVDSDSIGGGLTYNWVEINSVGTPVTAWTGSTDDGYFATTLPWSFPYYGNGYTNFFFTTNGWLGFNSPSAEYSNVAIPNVAEPNNAVYAWWDDLDAVGTSGDRTVYYYNDAVNGQYVVQWNNVRHLSATADTLKFEIILRPNGEILFQYNRMVSPSNLTTATIGIENADGSVGLQTVYNAAYIHNNLAIRFFLPDASWLGESPSFGRINPGATQNITVAFNATGLLPGTTYNGKIMMDLTHPDVTGTILIPASLRVNVATTPVIILSKDSITYLPTEIGFTRRDSLTVRNGGTPSLVVSSITSTNPRFVPSPTSMTIAPGDSSRLRITYSAVSPPHNDTGRVVILSNDPTSPRKDVLLRASAFGVAHVVVRPDTFFFSRGATPDTTFATFKVFSTGTDTLRYLINETSNSPFQEARSIERSKKQQPAVSLSKGATDPNPGERDSSGGPDAFGYRWIDSDSPGGPTFSWVDISTVGTPITTWTGTSDDGYATIPFPFTFSFYGTPFSGNINVCTNGFLSFTSTSTAYSNSGIPSTSAPLNGIFPFWDDQDLSTSGSVLYYHDVANNRFIVEWLNVPHYSSGGPYTYEAIFKPDGTILFQYETMDLTLTNSSTTGVQNATGTVALQVAYSSPYIVHNNLALLITSDIVPWMSTNRTQGVVAPGDSQAVQLRIHPFGTPAGLYTSYQRVGGNTPDTTGKVRVRLNLTPSGNAVVVNSPNGGESWTVGSTHSIVWTKSGAVDTVKIEYSTTGNGGPWNLIASGTPAKIGLVQHPKAKALGEGGGWDNLNGTFNWVIPPTPSANCFVKVSWKSTPTVFDVSDAAFTIAPAVQQGDTSWVQQTSGQTGTFYWVKALDENVAWAAGTGGIVVRTTNGGANWTSVGGGAIGTADVYTGDALDANTAFVSTSPGVTNIYKTTNGGALWTQVFTSATGFIDGVQMTSSSTGYAVGDPVASNWMLLKTTNGGTTWSSWATLPQVGTEAGWNNSFQVSGNNVWFGTNASKVYRSTDLGVTWTSGTTTAANSYGLHFNNATQGVAGFDAGANNNSSNGGSSWAAGAVAGTGQNTGVSGVLGSEFWMSSSAGSVYYTANLGVAWTNAAKNGYTGTTALWAISHVSPTSGRTFGWAVGASGRILRYRRIPVGVETTPDELPTVYALQQNFPNPFNPTTKIKYDLPEEATVTLKIYNVLGQEVVTLASGQQAPGRYNAVWDGRNDFGSPVSSGVYFYRFEAKGVSGQNFASLKKMLFLK